MIAYLRALTQKRAPWLLLLLSVLAFESCGLFFEHVMGLHPCVMCIYERVALLGIGIAALIALIDPTRFWLRWPALLLWGFSALLGLQLSLRHVDIQLNPSPFNTCSPFTEFPSYLPLDQWVPWMFTATGDCSEKQWSFLGWEMPQWLVLIFGVYIAICLVIMIGNLVKGRCCQ